MLLSLCSPCQSLGSVEMLSLWSVNKEDAPWGGLWVCVQAWSWSWELLPLAGVAPQDLTAWGLVRQSWVKRSHWSHSFHKSPDSVFIISVFFEINLTVAFLEFYLTEVRTKQPTFAADLWKAIIIRPSGKKAFLALQEWLRARSWRIDFLWLPHDSDSAVQKKSAETSRVL